MPTQVVRQLWFVWSWQRQSDCSLTGMIEAMIQSDLEFLSRRFNVVVRLIRHTS
ncbi:hypothetical protein [Brucella anthropi]|uniref:hypothetical protein n=1 Tax=Brucella anthropi TaxID=529 RepID=UPI0018656E5C|nr:hypothetical protein [Brucella anthropi]